MTDENPVLEDDKAEPADAGADHPVPGDLVNLHEVLEWDEALQKGPNQ